MRSPFVLASLFATITALRGLAAAEKTAPIHVAYDAEHLDLEKHVLQFKPSRAIDEATLSVIGEDGTELGTGVAKYDKAPADPWWTITWTQPADARVMVLRLHVAAVDGAVTNVKLIPWSVTVEHEDVTFRSDSAVVDADERTKLDASLAKITEIAKSAAPFMKLTLYIAGHTDTVGPTAKNRKLSLDRAVAIGQYLRSQKLDMQIVVAGFGEEVPKLKTADETDERANRRADYVLGPAGGTPPFKGPYAKVKADWRPLK